MPPSKKKKDDQKPNSLTDLRSSKEKMWPNSFSGKNQ